MSDVHAHETTCNADARVTCGGCGLSWCDRHDAGPAALCPQCHGRGYTLAPWTAREARGQGQKVARARRELLASLRRPVAA